MADAKNEKPKLVHCLCGNDLPWEDMKKDWATLQLEGSPRFECHSYHCPCGRNYDVTSGEFVLIYAPRGLTEGGRDKVTIEASDLGSLADVLGENFGVVEEDES